METLLRWSAFAFLTATIFFLTASVQAESEPNDSIEQAIPIVPGLSNAVQDATLLEEDEDYYSFTADAGSTYVIETFNIAATANGEATGLWLYNSTGSELDNDSGGNDGTGVANARIVYTFTRGGTYYVRVKDAYIADWTGTYSLRILPQHDQPGAAWDAENDFEPNDTLELALEIDVGLENARTHQLVPHSSYESNDSDYDYYRFTADANSTYVIETFNIEATENNEATGLWLYNSTGNELANDSGGNEGTGVANARIVYTFIQGGTYYVRVKDAYIADWTGTYSLRILPKHDQPGAAWNPANDYEPDDVLELAREIAVNSSQTHQLAPHSQFTTNDSDYDYYHFTAEAGSPYVIETFDIEANENNEATGLWLYNSTGSELDNDSGGNDGSVPGAARIEYTFTRGGTYYVRVKDAYIADWTGTYSLRVAGPGSGDGDEDDEDAEILPFAIYLPFTQQ
jgi:hypothetical protein